MGANLSAMPEIAGNIERLIKWARENAIYIIFVRTTHDSWTDDPVWVRRRPQHAPRFCTTGSWGADWYKVSPEPSDCIVTKHRYSAFIGTDLELILRSLSINTLITVGVATNVCVESTVRDAFMRGFSIVLIEDALAAPSLEEHRTSIDTMQKYFAAEVINTAQAENWWRSDRTAPK